MRFGGFVAFAVGGSSILGDGVWQNNMGLWACDWKQGGTYVLVLV